MGENEEIEWEIIIYGDSDSIRSQIYRWKNYFPQITSTYILDEFTDVNLILEALKRAVINPEAKNKLRYATSTLKNWHSELITTYQQL